MKTAQKPATVGNIVFGENGISIMRPYMDSDTMTQALVENHPGQGDLVEKALMCALEFVKTRIAHCQSELETNLSKAYAINECAVYWKDGHFSLPTFKLMQELVERNPKSWDDLSTAELQQIVRALYFQRHSKTETWWNSEVITLAFNLATEFMLCKSYK